MAWNDDLEGAALRIAATAASPLRVMAGPGTGKSFAMQRRVARLLEEARVDPRRILAVTFTRNAADNLVSDLQSLDIEGSEDIVASTLHSYCFGLLASEEVLALSGRSPRPVVTFSMNGVLQFEGRTMLSDLVEMGDFGGRRDCTRRIRAFEAAWARLQSEQPGWPTDPVDVRFQDALLGWLRFHRAMLIGELVPEAYRYLRNNPACEARRAFDHVVVDEYQDLNRAEQELIDLLAGNGELTIVGDLDQSIYRFRHANPEGIEDFAATHPDTHDEPLDECRRCPTRVVAIADSLIRHNHPREGRARLRPRPDNRAGEVYIVQWSSVGEESQGLADYVAWLIRDRGYRPGDILILTPRRLIGYRIRDRIGASGITVHSFYHEEALQEDAAQRAFAILTLLVDIEDRVALRWWLGHDTTTDRVGPYQRLRQYCEVSGVSSWEALTALLEERLSLPNVGGLVDSFQELRRELDALRNLPLPTLVDSVLPGNLDACRALREAALLALPSCESAGDLFKAVKTAVTQPETPEEGDFVRVMSLHKSKGLTSKAVFVADCIQGLIPYEDRTDPPHEQDQTLREQRRLFYVAMTRCTEILVLSSVLRLPRDLAFRIGAQIQGRGDPVRTVTSQFIDELGPEAPPPVLGPQWAVGEYR